MTKFSLAQTMGAAVALIVAPPALAQATGTPQTSAHDAAVQAEMKECLEVAGKAKSSLFAEGRGKQHQADTGKVQCIIALQYLDKNLTVLQTLQMEASDKAGNHMALQAGYDRRNQRQLRMFEKYVANSKSTQPYMNTMQGTIDSKGTLTAQNGSRTLDRDATTGFFGRIMEATIAVTNALKPRVTSIAPSDPAPAKPGSSPPNRPPRLVPFKIGS